MKKLWVKISTWHQGQRTEGQGTEDGLKKEDEKVRRLEDEKGLTSNTSLAGESGQVERPTSNGKTEDGGRKTEGRKENRGDRKEFDILDFLPRASVLEESSKAIKEYLGLVAGRMGIW